MKREWKKITSILLGISLMTLISCESLSTKKIAVYPNQGGTKEERIEYHKREISKYQAIITKEEKNTKFSLSQQDMDSARAAQSRKMQAQRKLNKHESELGHLNQEDQKCVNG